MDYPLTLPGAAAFNQPEPAPAGNGDQEGGGDAQ